MRELRVEDALMYLDQVKMEFGDRPHIYNEFLDIMKTFKSMQIDTPGVIQRVSALFHGNKRLVLGFNTFLPDGYKIEIPTDGSGLAVYREPGRREAIQITWPGMAEHLAMQQAQEAKANSGGGGGGGVAGGPEGRAAGWNAAGDGPTAPAASAMKPAAPPSNAAAASVAAATTHLSPPHPPAPQQPAPAQNNAPGQHVEFGHAINYVTTIKKRFASSPEIYRKFLEILHTYQKEQRGIKEVLDEVSSLFADHADLLKEFTYFLPDAVQGVAKKQLDQAAAKAEERMRLRQLAQQKQDSNAPGVKLPAIPKEEPKAPAAHVKKIPFGATQARSENEETEIRKGVVYGDVKFDPVRPPRCNELNPTQAAHMYGRPKSIPLIPIEPNIFEIDVFTKIKTHLEQKDTDSSKTTVKKNDSYKEFTKLLHLCGIGILSKDELIQLLRGLFGKANSTGIKPNQLLSQLEKVMNQRCPSAQSLKKKQPSKQEETEGAAATTTPSYYRYPKDFVFGTFSGETEKDKRVINYKVFAAKNKEEMKAIEDYDGVRWRRNVHEGIMNRVEEEMFEVDIAIERNAQTLKMLTPIAEEMKKLKEAEEKAGQPIGRLQYHLKPRSLNSIQIGAIARIYGDSGDEVIQHLLSNPLMVVPIVHERMLEKDREWRKAKATLMQGWKKEIMQHCHNSLDVKSYFYMVELEKNVSDENFIEECQGIIEPKQLDIQQIKFHTDHNPGMLLFDPYLLLSPPKFILHEGVYKLVSSQVKSNHAMIRVWDNFIAPWFGLSQKGDISTVVYKAGEKVKTTMGDGEILSVQGGDDPKTVRCLVKFPFGEGLVRSNAILQVISPHDTPAPVDVDALYKNLKNPDDKVLFGTASMYISLRLYMCLATVLSKLNENITDPEYNSLLTLATKKGSDAAEYETQCRKIAGALPELHMFLNIPHLVKRCAEAFSQMSEEDESITLAHFSQLQIKDINHLRSLSLEVTDKAVYRIQMNPNELFFNYLPSKEELRLSDSIPLSMEAEEIGDTSLEPEAKRQKTADIMVE